MVPTKWLQRSACGWCVSSYFAVVTELLILMVLEIRTEADDEGRLQNEIAPVQNNLYNHSISEVSRRR